MSIFYPGSNYEDGGQQQGTYCGDIIVYRMKGGEYFQDMFKYTCERKSLSIGNGY